MAVAAAVCVCSGLFTPNAWARTIDVNARAQIGLLSSSGGVLQFAGAVSDPGIGNGGLLATVHPAAGAYVGTATFLNRFGSATLALHVAVRKVGPLYDLSVAGAVTAASGRFAGARGTLTGSTTVNPSLGVGVLRLRGTLRGAAGGAPAPLRGIGVRHVDGRFHGVEVSLERSGLETIVGSATGVVPGPAVVVVHDRATATTVHGTFTLFAAGGSLTGVISVRLRGRGAARSESGTARITGGAGELSGARSTSAAVVTGTRNLVTQLIALRIRGAFTP